MQQKVSERHACSMAAAFHEEIEEAGVATASSDFLSQVARLSKTKHEHGLMEILEEWGLQVKVPISWVDVGLPSQRPVLRLQDFLHGLSTAGKIAWLPSGLGTEIPDRTTRCSGSMPAT